MFGSTLSADPGFSLIILTPMKILQINLNSSTFVAWKVKKNVSAVRNILATRSSGPPASQPVSCLTRLSADRSVSWLRVPTRYGCCLSVLVYVICEFTEGSWKMYRYAVVERVFIVRTYWKTEWIKSCQQQLLEKFVGRHPPSKSSFWALPKELETKGNSSKNVRGNDPKYEGPTTGVSQEVTAPTFTGFRVVQKHFSTCCEKKRSLMHTASPWSTN